METEYYTVKESDAGQYTLEAFGKFWAVDMHRVDRGKLYPVAVNPSHVGKRVYRFTDSIGRECLQVEGETGRAARYTAVFVNQEA